MSENNQNNQRKVYIRSTKQWVPVTEEVYLEYYRPIWRIQKKAQKNGQCMCPKAKLWLCDGDCALCEYRAAGNITSLDAPIENGDGDEFTLVDTLEDPNAAFADVIVDRLCSKSSSMSWRSKTPKASASASLLWKAARKQK